MSEFHPGQKPAFVRRFLVSRSLDLSFRQGDHRKAGEIATEAFMSGDSSRDGGESGLHRQARPCVDRKIRAASSKVRYLSALEQLLLAACFVMSYESCRMLRRQSLGRVPKPSDGRAWNLHAKVHCQVVMLRQTSMERIRLPTRPGSLVWERISDASGCSKTFYGVVVNGTQRYVRPFLNDKSFREHGREFLESIVTRFQFSSPACAGDVSASPERRQTVRKHS